MHWNGQWDTVYIGCRFNSVSSINCAHLHGAAPVYLSTMCQPVSENIGHRFLRLAVTWRSGCSCHKDGALRSSQLCCVVWPVRQHVTLYQRRCMITHRQWHLFVANLWHSSSTPARSWLLSTVRVGKCNYTVHQHPRSSAFSIIAKFYLLGKVKSSSVLTSFCVCMYVCM